MSMVDYKLFVLQANQLSREEHGNRHTSRFFSENVAGNNNVFGNVAGNIFKDLVRFQSAGF